MSYNNLTHLKTTILSQFTTIYGGLKKLKWSILNNQPFPTFVKNFMMYLIPIFIWLFIIILINILPRPYILTKFLLRFDNYIFDVGVLSLDKHLIGPLSCLLCVVTGSLLLEYNYYNYVPPNKNHKLHFLAFQPSTIRTSSSSSSSSSSFDYEKSFLEDSDPFESSSSLDLESEDTDNDPINQKLINQIDQVGYLPYNAWLTTPLILLNLSWVIINLLYSQKDHVTKFNNITAWAFYVIVHLVAPIVVVVWLYLFHPPNSIKIFITTIGFNNILIAMIHLVFPNAPPLFIKLYGETMTPTNELPYTDGITRQDMKLGDSLYRAVYYVAPNKFTSCPSIHASMSSLIVFFVCFYSRYSWFKLVAIVYLLGEWWSAMYLDHHWRVDILLGLICAIFTWTISLNLKRFGVLANQESYYKLRLKSTVGSTCKVLIDDNNNYEDSEGVTTMGMRLFSNTRFQDFFDPLA
ncbi:hypothetical protein DFJ63DRAFT_313471 [Scheffersomyces coipomensis]|uniref:uncharacterized protein n=1 Tax=Scheffersomyces coipomensis TaxID=1788519 RepID=UPI00315CB45A